jgi:hypothetical protein
MNKKLENEFYQGITFDSKRLELDLLKGYEFKIYNEESEFIGILTYDSIRKFWKPKNLILGS